jgi:hypothetical protein
MIDHADTMAKLACMRKQSAIPSLGSSAVMGGLGGAALLGGTDLLLNRNPKRALTSALMGGGLGAGVGMGAQHLASIGGGSLSQGAMQALKDINPAGNDDRAVRMAGDPNKTLSINQMTPQAEQPTGPKDFTLGRIGTQHAEYAATMLQPQMTRKIPHLFRGGIQNLIGAHAWMGDGPDENNQPTGAWDQAKQLWQHSVLGGGKGLNQPE